MRKKKIFPILLLLIMSILASVIVFSIFSPVSREGFVEANVVDVQDSSVIVGRDCKAIVAETSEERAQSILDGLEGIITGRPNTHDIFVATIKSFNISLDSIQLTRFDGKNYYANLILVSGNKVLTLDSRPSDAIAIAVRTNATILMNQSLLDIAGQDICL